MQRETWTDARLDERFDRIDERFDRVDERFNRVDRELLEVKGEVGELRSLIYRFGSATLVAIVVAILTRGI